MILGTISRWWVSVSSTLVWMMTKTLISVASRRQEHPLGRSQDCFM
jgi:hypothetical protein